MLVTVIVLFVVCWGPSLIDNVLVSFGLVEQLNYGHLKHLRQTFALLSYFNSCVNPFVYAFMSRNFRKSFKYAMCSCFPKKGYRGVGRNGRQASFQTGTSSLSHGQSLKSEGESRNSHLRCKLLSHTAVKSDDSDVEYETNF